MSWVLKMYDSNMHGGRIKTADCVTNINVIINLLKIWTLYYMAYSQILWYYYRKIWSPSCQSMHLYNS